MTTLNILQRLHAVMSEVDYIQKEKKQGMRYSIVTHDAVTAKVRPLLVKHGVVYYPISVASTQDGNRTQVHMTVRFASIDNPGDYINVETMGYGLDDQDKGPGKAISYAVKYALLKALGLESGDDPDEDQSTTHKSAVAERTRLWVAGTEASIKAATALEDLRTIWSSVNASKDIDETQRKSLFAAITKRKDELAVPVPAE